MSKQARVINAHSNRGVAHRDDGEIVAFHFPRRLVRPLAGDLIELDDDDSLIAVAPRANEFGRGDARGRFRPMAANLDRLVIVIAPEPAPSADLVHRYLTASWLQGIQPVLLINKNDLALPDQPPFTELDDLRRLGVEIVHCRCRPDPDLGLLESTLAGGISLLAGQSGVGKSSLLNALIPDLEAQTGALSRVTGKGTHTTTASSLHQLPMGGWLVDTPGVWEYSLWAMTAEALEQGFPDFTAREQSCRFRDCRHQNEPGCGVRAAVESGLISQPRYEAWLRLLDEQLRLGALDRQPYSKRGKSR